MPDAPPPVIVSERSLRGLNSIRHTHVIQSMFGGGCVTQSVAEAMQAEVDDWPVWLTIAPDDPDVELPPRLVHVSGTDRATLQLAVRTSAPMVLIEGKALIEKVKLSYIKSMGVIPLLVQAYREGHIKAVKPLLVALERKGHEMLPPEQMDALFTALDHL